MTRDSAVAAGPLDDDTAGSTPFVALLPSPPPPRLVPLPPRIVGAILAITGLYVVVSEASKRFFYRRMDPGRRTQATG